MLRILIKITVISLVALAMSACGSRIDSISETVNYAVFGEPDVTLTKEQIAEKKYPLQYLTFKGQSRVALGLGFDDKGLYKWLSQEYEVVVTKNGRIVQTQGLKKDIEWVSNLSQDPLACLTKAQENCPTTWEATVQLGDDVNASTHAIQSSMKPMNEEVLTMPDGTELQAQRWVERMTQSNGKSWTNYYWIEENTRRVIKSEQRITEQFPKAYVEEVKPYSADLKAAGANS